MRRLFLAIFLLTSPLVADDNPLIAELDFIEEPSTVKDYDFRREFLKMLVILSTVVGLVVATAWMVKRVGRQRMHSFNKSSMIQILERRNLSPKSMIYLLEVDGQRLVVGDSQAGGLCFFGALGGEVKPLEESAFAKIMQHEVGSSPFSVEKTDAKCRPTDPTNATDKLRPTGAHRP